MRRARWYYGRQTRGGIATAFTSAKEGASQIVAEDRHAASTTS